MSRAQEVPGGLPRLGLHPSTHLALPVSRELSRYIHGHLIITADEMTHWCRLTMTVNTTAGCEF